MSYPRVKMVDFTLLAGRILTPKSPIATMSYWLGLITPGLPLIFPRVIEQRVRQQGKNAHLNRARRIFSDTPVVYE